MQSSNTFVNLVDVIAIKISVSALDCMLCCSVQAAEMVTKRMIVTLLYARFTATWVMFQYGSVESVWFSTSHE